MTPSQKPKQLKLWKTCWVPAGEAWALCKDYEPRCLRLAENSLLCRYWTEPECKYMLGLSEKLFELLPEKKKRPFSGASVQRYYRWRG
jgi:hypothetical protein